MAPDRDWSGAGASLGPLLGREPIAVTRAELPGAEHVEASAVGGPPGLAVMAANLGAFGPRPDLIVSGINRGLNAATRSSATGTSRRC